MRRQHCPGVLRNDGGSWITSCQGKASATNAVYPTLSGVSGMFTGVSEPTSLSTGPEICVDLPKEAVASGSCLLHTRIQVSQRFGGNHFFLRLALSNQRRYPVADGDD